MGVDDFYSSDYQRLLNEGAVGFVSKLVHKSLEHGLSADNFSNILEVGAGLGQHLPHVKSQWANYYETDIRLDNLPNREKITPSTQQNIISVEVDAQNLSQFPDNTFDRIIATCLIVHLKEADRALEEWKRVCKPGGLITIYLPCEPGIFLRLLRSLTTSLKAKRMGVDHAEIHYREHVTYFVRIWVLIKSIFSESSINRIFYPLFIPSWNLNLWCVIQIKK